MSKLAKRIEGLSPAQRKLLESRLERKGLDLSRALILPRQDSRAATPLSFSQERLWFLEYLAADQAVYNVPQVLRLSGSLNLAALGKALFEVVERHQVLRSYFPMAEGRPVQQVRQAERIPVPLIDLGGMPRKQPRALAQRWVDWETRRSFNLAQGPLLRVLLLRLAPQDHILVLTLHHIVSDGWSTEILVRELTILYRAFCEGQPSPLEPQPLQYADFATWQRRWLVQDTLEKQLAYWRDRLSNSPPLLNLPTDRQRPPVQTFPGASTSQVLPESLSTALKALSLEVRSSLFMTLLAAFQLLLSRATGQVDIPVGTPVAGRNRGETEGLVGCFVNTLVMRGDLGGDPTVLGLLERVRERVLEAQAHQDIPFEMLVDRLQPERSLSHPPLFQVMFVLRNALGEELSLPGLSLTPFAMDNRTSKFDLMLTVNEGPRLVTSLRYNTDLFDHATVDRLLRYFLRLLAGMVENPQQPLSRLPLLTTQERHQLLVEWNDTRTTAPPFGCIHHFFEFQASQAPAAVALVTDRRQFTYGELNRQANGLAVRLRSLGVGAEGIVGVAMRRRPEMVVALLAILKAGGAYLPLDPDYPQERLRFMVQDAKAAVLVTEPELRAQLPADGVPQICLGTDWRPEDEATSENPCFPVRSGNLAYVIYTSGSTGRPKGVAIEHRSAAAMITWAAEVFSPRDLGGVLASTSFCFDLSVFEMFAPLGHGGTVVLLENILDLTTVREKWDIQLINSVPSAVAEILRSKALPPSVRIVNLAGEPLPRPLVDALYEVDTVEAVYNLYGPSEDTTYTTYACVERGTDATPPIGHPVANTSILLLGPHLQPAGMGLPGELHTGGDGLARGYLEYPRLTAERFVPDPFSREPGQRLYRTGDLARRCPGGELEYLGRIDHQVKVRGFRIELGEIESTLRKHVAVKECVVVVRLHADQQMLTAYVVYKEGTSPSLQEIKGFLRERIPDFMVPVLFEVLPALPLNPNGKLDRAALPAPKGLRPDSEVEFVGPSSELEKSLVEIWSSLLPVKEVGIQDNFFDLGGHSLLIPSVQQQIQEKLGLEVSVVDLFRFPSIGTLAEFLQGKTTKEGAAQEGRDWAEVRKQKMDRRRRLSKRRQSAAAAREPSHD